VKSHLAPSFQVSAGNTDLRCEPGVATPLRHELRHDDSRSASPPSSWPASYPYRFPTVADVAARPFAVATCEAGATQTGPEAVRGSENVSVLHSRPSVLFSVAHADTVHRMVALAKGRSKGATHGHCYARGRAMNRNSARLPNHVAVGADRCDAQPRLCDIFTIIRDEDAPRPPVDEVGRTAEAAWCWSTL
jgi:hypothetical protein